MEKRKASCLTIWSEKNKVSTRTKMGGSTMPITKTKTRYPTRLSMAPLVVVKLTRLPIVARSHRISLVVGWYEVKREPSWFNW